MHGNNIMKDYVMIGINISSVFLLISQHTLTDISSLEATVIQCLPAKWCETFFCIKSFGVQAFLNGSDWADQLLLIQIEWHKRLPAVINSNSAAPRISHNV